MPWLRVTGNSSNGGFTSHTRISFPHVMRILKTSVQGRCSCLRERPRVYFLWLPALPFLACGFYPPGRKTAAVPLAITLTFQAGRRETSKGTGLCELSRHCFPKVLHSRLLFTSHWPGRFAWSLAAVELGRIFSRTYCILVKSGFCIGTDYWGTGRHVG